MRVIEGAKKLWRKYFSRSFFRKIFLVYLGITLVTELILFLLLSQNLITINYDQALIMSDQCIITVDSFLENKMDNATAIHKRLYQDTSTWHIITRELEDPGSAGMDAWGQQEVRTAVINTFYGIDREFNGLMLGSFVDGSTWLYGNGDMTTEKLKFQQYLEACRAGEDTDSIISGRTDKSRGNTFSIFLLTTVRAEDFRKDIGCMGVYFNAMNIRQSYRQYEEYLKGKIYVFDRGGELLYDSSESYELGADFPTEQLLAKKSGRMTIGKQVYNIRYSSADGYYVINAFPISEVMKDVRITQRTLIAVFFAALLFAVLLNYLSTQIFAKRLIPITDTIRQVRNGHLTSFPIHKKYDDEVGYIYTELLRMCAALDDHIQKEYVYKLEQKEMELYALQAQIDPHFLYNSLEAIRMKLYVKGETEASKMIWILSDLFRNLMKKDAVVTNREEIGYLHSYLELFQFRLGDRMQYKFDVEEEVMRYATIKHILQPIVENALVHGIEDAGTEEHPCTITIEGRKEEGDIVFVIRDDGCGMSEEKLQEIRGKLENDQLFQKSIGIYNVSSRLRIVYGPAYRLRVESALGEGTVVTARIKAMKKRELEEYVQIVDR